MDGDGYQTNETYTSPVETKNITMAATATKATSAITTITIIPPGRVKKSPSIPISFVVSCCLVGGDVGACSPFTAAVDNTFVFVTEMLLLKDCLCKVEPPDLLEVMVLPLILEMVYCPTEWGAELF